MTPWDRKGFHCKALEDVTGSRGGMSWHTAVGNGKPTKKEAVSIEIY